MNRPQRLAYARCHLYRQKYQLPSDLMVSIDAGQSNFREQRPKSLLCGSIFAAGITPAMHFHPATLAGNEINLCRDIHVGEHPVAPGKHLYHSCHSSICADTICLIQNESNINNWGAPDAGHSAFEPGNTDALARATDGFR